MFLSHNIGADLSKNLFPEKNWANLELRFCWIFTWRKIQKTNKHEGVWGYFCCCFECFLFAQFVIRENYKLNQPINIDRVLTIGPWRALQL